MAKRGGIKRKWNNSTIWCWFCNVTQGIDWDPQNLRTKPSAWFGRPEYVDRTVFMTNSDALRVLVGPSALRQWPSGPISLEEIWHRPCGPSRGSSGRPEALRAIRFTSPHWGISLFIWLNRGTYGLCMFQGSHSAKNRIFSQNWPKFALHTKLLGRDLKTKHLPHKSYIIVIRNPNGNF